MYHRLIRADRKAGGAAVLAVAACLAAGPLVVGTSAGAATTTTTAAATTTTSRPSTTTTRPASSTTQPATTTTPPATSTTQPPTTTGTTTTSSCATQTTLTSVPSYTPGQVVRSADFEDGAIPSWLGAFGDVRVEAEAALSGAYGLRVTTPGDVAALQFSAGHATGDYKVTASVRGAPGEPTRRVTWLRRYTVLHYQSDAVAESAMSVSSSAWSTFQSYFVTKNVFYDVSPCTYPYKPGVSSISMMVSSVACDGQAGPASLYVDDIKVTYLGSTPTSTGPTSWPGGCTPPTTTTTPPLPSCQVDYKIVHTWPGWFVASVTVTNNDPAPISDWSVGWSFTGDEKVVSL